MCVDPDKYLSTRLPDGIWLLNHEVLDAFDKASGTEPYTTASAVAFKAWCDTQRVHYYAHPDDIFSIQEAIDQATEAGCPYLIADNLS